MDIIAKVTVMGFSPTFSRSKDLKLTQVQKFKVINSGSTSPMLTYRFKDQVRKSGKELVMQCEGRGVFGHQWPFRKRKEPWFIVKK